MLPAPPMTDPEITTDPSITLSPSRTTNRTLALHQARLARRRRMRIVGAAVGLLLVAGVGAIALLDPLDRDERPMPSDEQVRQLWNARRADFEALRSMIDADRNLTVVGENRVDGCAREAKDLSWGCPGAPGLELGAMLRNVRPRPGSIRPLSQASGGHRGRSRRPARRRRHRRSVPGGARGVGRRQKRRLGADAAGAARRRHGSRSPEEPHRQLRGAVGRLVHRALERIAGVRRGAFG